MTAARFTVSVSALALPDAQALAERIEDDLGHDPLAVTINEVDEARGLWETVAYFAQAAEAAACAADYAGQVAEVPDTDWVRRSLEGLAPVAAGRFFLHGSHDRDKRRIGGISLEIDAGTAFGTGHHGTTEGCLTALDRLLKRLKPRRILDVGCGTGVLAIAASKASGRASTATDIDPEAVRVTALNARLNGAAALVSTFPAPGLKDRRFAERAPFDLIFANILARPLVSLARGLSLILSRGGHLILSGLTEDQARWILATYRNHGLVPVSCIYRGNWATLVLTKPASRKRRRRILPVPAIGRGWEDA